jgi:hypothetical protein
VNGAIQTTNHMQQVWPAGAGFGYLAYKRPRLAMFAGGLVAFTTLPYVSANAVRQVGCAAVPGVLPSCQSMLTDCRYCCLQAAAMVYTVNRWGTLLGQQLSMHVHVDVHVRMHHSVCCRTQALHTCLWLA